MCWPSPISSRTLKPTCGAISNISPASPSGCSWPIRPPVPRSVRHLDPGWSGKAFLILAMVVQVALAPLVLLLRQPIELLLQADAWLLGCAMWGCGAGRIMRERLSLGSALLALPLFAMLFDSNWSVPTAAASVVHNPGQRPPPPLWFVTILVALGWLWMTRPRRPFPGDNTNDHHSEGTV